MKRAILLSELWEKTCQDQQAAYDLLHGQLFPELHHYLFQMAKDTDLARDLLQDIFINIWLKRQRIGSIANVKSYFYSACRTIYINYYRKQQRQQSSMAYYQFNEEEQSIEEQIVYSEDNRRLHSQLLNAMEKLPSRQKEMIYLRFFKELEYEHISSITGLKYQSVVNHVYRAVQLMRNEFKINTDVCQLIIPIQKTFAELNQAS